MIVHRSFGKLPVVHLPCDGPTVVSLAFRVGVVDEPLPWRGMTRIVERLVVSQLDGAGLDVAASTGATETRFVCEGSPEQAAHFVSRVVEGLRRPGVDDLDRVQRELRDEHQDRGLPVGDAALAWRYGPNGHGLVGYPELGLQQRAASGAIRRWSQERFVANNAVLSVLGTLPHEADCDLPDGLHHPVAPSPRPLRAMPAWLPNDGITGTVVSMVGESSAVLAALAGHLDRHVRDHLRRRLGTDVDAHVWTETLGTDHCQLVVFAPSPPRAGEQVRQAVVDFLERFVDAGVSAADHERWVEAFTQFAESDEGRRADLDEAAIAVLHRREPVNIRERLAQLETFDPAGFGLLLGELMASALYIGGGRDSAPPQLPGLQTDTSRSPVTGRRFKRVPVVNEDGRWIDDRLVVGPQGVSLQVGGVTRTVRFAEVRAVEACGDSLRVLYGGDGVTIGIDTNDWEAGWHLSETIDASVPSSLIVRTGSSGTVQVPRRTGVSTVSLVLFIVIATISILGAVTGTFPSRPAGTDVSPLRMVWLAGLAGLAIWSARTLWRRHGPWQSDVSR